MAAPALIPMPNEFKTTSGVLEFHNETVHIWRCPNCIMWWSLEHLFPNGKVGPIEQCPICRHKRSND